MPMKSQMKDQKPKKETAPQRKTCCLTDRNIRDRDRANGWHDMMDATKKAAKWLDTWPDT